MRCNNCGIEAEKVCVYDGRHHCQIEDIRSYVNKIGIQRWKEGMGMRDGKLNGYYVTWVINPFNVPTEVFVEAFSAEDAAFIAKVNNGADRVVSIRAVNDV